MLEAPCAKPTTWLIKKDRTDTLICGPCGCGRRFVEWLRQLCFVPPARPSEDIHLVESATKPTRYDEPTSSISSLKSENQVAVEDFEREGLHCHNEYRRMHGVSDLRLNAELCKYARDWAFMLLQLDKYASRTNCLYGENLYMSYRPDPNVKVIAQKACESWYNEIYIYDFAKGPGSRATANFTQMIWKSTKELGIGMAKSSKKVIVVANYNPKGNNRDDFAANCPRPIK